MTLSRRVASIVASAVALAVILTAAASYLAVSTELRRQTDRQIRAQADAVVAFAVSDDGAAFLESGRGAGGFGSPDRQARSGFLPSSLGAASGGPLGTMQFVPAGGRPAVMIANMGGPYPVADVVDRAVANGKRGTTLRTVQRGGSSVRSITVRAGDLGAVQVSQPLSGIEAVDHKLALLLLLIGVAGVAAGLLASAILTRRVTAPVRELAGAARHITDTHDLTRRIPDPEQDDEVSQLTRQFNEMLDSLQSSREALRGSVQAQRQLVADASHELRTPITSLRTNLELLLEDTHFSPDERTQILASLVAGTTELGELVGDVIDLARGDSTPPTFEPVDLAAVVVEQVERARRHHPGVAFTVRADATPMQGAPDRLARAVANLLDNAAKHTADGGSVDVTVAPTRVVVRDHGPGIADHDLPHLFDRFYRGEGDRVVVGTGLGLAIVLQVAEIHGGTVTATNAADGGAVFTLELATDAAAAADT